MEEDTNVELVPTTNRQPSPEPSHCLRISAALAGKTAGLPEPLADRQLEAFVEHGLLFAERTSQGPAHYRMPALAHLFARERAADEGR
jgi:hypothetical protein